MKVVRNVPKPKRISMSAHFVMTRLVQIGPFGEEKVLIPSESRSWHWKTYVIGRSPRSMPSLLCLLTTLWLRYVLSLVQDVLDFEKKKKTPFSLTAGAMPCIHLSFGLVFV